MEVNDFNLRKRKTYAILGMIKVGQFSYQKAIDICKLALKYDLTDNTKSGYAGRLEKLQKKLVSSMKA